MHNEFSCFKPKLNVTPISYKEMLFILISCMIYCMNKWWEGTWNKRRLNFHLSSYSMYEVRKIKKSKTKITQTKQLACESSRSLAQRRWILEWESSWDIKGWNPGHRVDNWQLIKEETSPWKQQKMILSLT